MADPGNGGPVPLGLGLASLVLFCETRSCMLVVIMTLKDAATFQVLFIVSLFCACADSVLSLLWSSTVALTYLTFHSNHRPISHRFRDKRRENRQFFLPRVYSPR